MRQSDSFLRSQVPLSVFSLHKMTNFASLIPALFLSSSHVVAFQPALTCPLQETGIKMREFFALMKLVNIERGGFFFREKKMRVSEKAVPSTVVKLQDAN